jgi:hypothetical protein
VPARHCQNEYWGFVVTDRLDQHDIGDNGRCHAARGRAAQAAVPSRRATQHLNAAKAKLSTPAVKMAGINSMVAEAAKLSMPAVKMAGINSMVAEAAKLSMPAVKMAGINSMVAEVAKAIHYPESGDGASVEADIGLDLDIVRNGTASPEVLAALVSLIVFALLVGFWLNEANRTGSDFLTANRFSLVADGSFICGVTAAAYRIALTWIRNLNR